MTPSDWTLLLIIVVAVVFFLSGYKFGKMSGHTHGFEEGIHFERKVQAHLRELTKKPPERQDFDSSIESKKV